MIFKYSWFCRQTTKRRGRPPVFKFNLLKMECDNMHYESHGGRIMFLLGLAGIIAKLTGALTLGWLPIAGISVAAGLLWDAITAQVFYKKVHKLALKQSQLENELLKQMTDAVQKPMYIFFSRYASDKELGITTMGGPFASDIHVLTDAKEIELFRKQAFHRTAEDAYVKINAQQLLGVVESQLVKNICVHLSGGLTATLDKENFMTLADEAGVLDGYEAVVQEIVQSVKDHDFSTVHLYERWKDNK